MSLMIDRSASPERWMVRAKVALLAVQVGVQQQFRHAQHPVHRRADFVTHVGEKFSLGGRRLFRLDLRRRQLRFDSLLLLDLVGKP